MLVDLPRRVGPAWAREMSLTGNFVDAETALRIGLVNHVVPHDELVPFAVELATAIAEQDRTMVSAMRTDWDATDRLPVAAAHAEHNRFAQEQGLRDGTSADLASHREGVIRRAHEQLVELTGRPARPAPPAARLAVAVGHDRGMSYEHILFEVDDPVAIITLNRPEALNAWTQTMANELRDAIGKAEKDPNVVGIVLTGAGKGFCAGADMKGLAAASGADGGGGRTGGPDVAAPRRGGADAR